jgi:hypothetical protein
VHPLSKVRNKNPSFLLPFFEHLLTFGSFAHGFVVTKLPLPNVLDHEKKESLLGTCDEQQFYYRATKVASPIRRKVAIHPPI